MSSNTLNSITAVLLTLNLASLVWYTVETTRLRKAAASQLNELARQRELSTLPLLVVVAEHVSGGKSDKVSVSNIGNGPALRVSFQTIPIPMKNLKNMFYVLDSIPLITPGQTLTIGYKQLVGDEPYADESVIHFLREDPKDALTVTALFADIQGASRRQDCTVAKNYIAPSPVFGVTLL